jgi:hypothetical protein
MEFFLTALIGAYGEAICKKFIPSVLLRKNGYPALASLIGRIDHLSLWSTI